MAKKILVVGGVAGGASFAARMRRLDEDAQIIVYERGQYISFANCGLPYHIGGEITEREKLLVQTPPRFKQRFNVDVRTNSEVTAVDPVNNAVTISSAGATITETFDYLVLAPGSKPIRPALPGIDDWRIQTLRTLDDMDHIKTVLNSMHTRKVVVVGGGFIGLEMAENLRHRNCDVTLVEMLDQVFAPADKEMAILIHEQLAWHGVHVELGDGVAAFEPRGEAVTVVLTSGKRLSAELVILAIGVRPDTGFLTSSGITLSERGAIVVNEKLQTNYDHIFAVGDAVEVVDFITRKNVLIPLAGPANRQGRIAADVIAGLPSTYKHTQGTAICRMFDLTIAVTGANEKQLKAAGIDYLKSYTHGTQHASYFPNAFPLSLKLLFAKTGGTVLGAQVVGKDGIDKRIDVLATSIRHGLTVSELSELELAYAPPFGSAKDPINMAGFVAANMLDGRMEVWYAEDAPGLDRSQNVLLDVRTKAEVEQGTIPGALNIPLDDLRSRLAELPRDKPLYVFCQVGLRGYLAASTLRQHGFQVKNLSGGYKTYQSVLGHPPTLAYTTPQTEAACSTPAQDTVPASVRINAEGLQCPGPIMKLKEALDQANDGALIEITATEPGFAADMPSWCKRTGHDLVSLNLAGGIFTAVVQKLTHDETAEPQVRSNRKTMVLFSDDFDRAMAAFIIANGAVTMGSDVTIFFTFWGLNLLRRSQPVPAPKTLVEKMFSFMMPRGASQTVLSKLNMFGLGTAMMRAIMRQKHVYSLETLMHEAIRNGVHLVACTMTMDLMGIKAEELIDGVELGGVATYLEKADNAGYNVFI